MEVTTNAAAWAGAAEQLMRENLDAAKVPARLKIVCRAKDVPKLT
jgi:hypothetical protein